MVADGTGGVAGWPRCSMGERPSGEREGGRGHGDNERRHRRWRRKGRRDLREMKTDKISPRDQRLRPHKRLTEGISYFFFFFYPACGFFSFSEKRLRVPCKNTSPRAHTHAHNIIRHVTAQGRRRRGITWNWNRVQRRYNTVTGIWYTHNHIRQYSATII